MKEKAKTGGAGKEERGLFLMALAKYI